MFGEHSAIWMREMRQAARLGRTPWVIFGLTLSISLLMCSIGGIAASQNASPASLGQGLFQAFFSIAYFVVCVVGPAIAANSIASEREGKTWEAVQLTGLHPKDIARGKFMAAYTTIALYIVALAPVGALPFLFGGVTATDVVTAFAFLFLVAALAVAFGLAMSSLMSSSRGAIVVTLILAICIGPALYAWFGFGASFAVHALWESVPEAIPIWLPLAYSRVPFGLQYGVILVAIPMLLVLVPAWFLYEITVANLTSDTDDRSTGIRRWFFCSAPLIALVCALPSTFVQDDEDHAVAAMWGLVGYGMFVGFCSLLFAFEPAGPSRRVRVMWKRAGAGALRRFFGPGLTKASSLALVLGAGGMFAITAIDMGALFIEPVTGTSGVREMVLSQIFVFGAYGAAFVAFSLGLTSFIRARGTSPWIARLIASAVMFLVAAGPWVVAAIAGAMAGNADMWLLVGAPSPCFAFYMVNWIRQVHDGTASESIPVVQAGLACAALWALLGLLLLAFAARRTSRTVREQEAQFANAEAALRAEDEALAAQAAQAVQTPSEAAPATGT
jgi:ABC-type transport system involved in multi-copper enzyme maturation permease subunit